jgi:hypothetical protein
MMGQKTNRRLRLLADGVRSFSSGTSDIEPVFVPSTGKLKCEKIEGGRQNGNSREKARKTDKRPRKISRKAANPQRLGAGNRENAKTGGALHSAFAALIGVSIPAIGYSSGLRIDAAPGNRCKVIGKTEWPRLRKAYGATSHETKTNRRSAQIRGDAQGPREEVKDEVFWPEKAESGSNCDWKKSVVPFVILLRTVHSTPLAA